MSDLYGLGGLTLIITGAGTWLLGLVVFLVMVIRGVVAARRAIVRRRVRRTATRAASMPAAPPPVPCCPSCGHPAPAAQ
ncbi:hypothetical protein ACFRNT_14345 [Streptomyces sp. NPDC056697]|uniref:hypothetical protein n=1 Tax=Streptomyces sp. NPDC056697 TaxID=3345915 RepID=UPI0036BF9854